MKYPKPDRFSDPCKDWDGCEDRLAEILRKDDQSLTTEDFNTIFHSNVPAADYVEGAYYIEKCAAHIATGKEINDSRFPDGFLWWLAHFKDNLIADQLYDEAKRLVVVSFWTLLDDFELFDLTEDECAKRGMNCAYSIGPFNRGTVCDFVDALTELDEFGPELEGILTRLIESEALPHTRWHVEIAFHVRWWLIAEDGHMGPDFRRRRETVFQRLHAFPIFHNKYWTAMTAARREGKHKYEDLISPV